MGSDTGFQSAHSAERRDFWDDPTPAGRSPQEATYRLTKRAALSVIFLLSLGLWAAIWTVVASLASAALG
ncbi:MAG TPA: hypothetical protein VKG22_09370 [Stellaceae bacterium]|nr:hypothetical protein [Stellaceae bacterium]HMD66837.1 hypothetical protein [Stellaceae bacterium]